MTAGPVPPASRLELAGLALVVAAALLLAGGLSRRWVAGSWPLGDTYDLEDVYLRADAGPMGVHVCAEDGCVDRGWKPVPQASLPRWLGAAVALGEAATGAWCLVAGLLALGGSVRGLAWTWTRWLLAAEAGLALLLVAVLVVKLRDPSLLEGAVFGLLGPFVGWFAVARLVRPVLVQLELSGDPTGATLK